MNYKSLSIERLQNVVDNLYRQECEANDERKKAMKVLRLKIKERAAQMKVDHAEEEYLEAKDALGELTLLQKIRIWMGI